MSGLVGTGCPQLGLKLSERGTWLDTFQITIQRASEQGWPVVVEWSDDSKSSLPVRYEGVFQFDQAALKTQVTPRDYGTMLGQALFRDGIRDAFLQARTRSESGLSVLLLVEDVPLRDLRWERLCAPLDGGWDFLSLNQRTPFSLYLPSATDRRFRVFGRRDLRALVVVASPEGLERYGLAPFDVEAAVMSVQTALGEIPCDILATVKEAVGPPTLDAICEQITSTSYTLLHIICHGRYQVSLSTVQDLTQRFYQRLREHGQVDLAVVEACAGLAERFDITVPALYSRLGPRLLFTDALDRELSSEDIRWGLSRLKDLFLERAPVLWEPLQQALEMVQTSLGATASLSEEGRIQRKTALDDINKYCRDALDLSFHELALGRDPRPYDSRCPFRGLTAFGPEHQEFFFGRGASSSDCSSGCVVTPSWQ
jgi:hypothetical protein